jgi:hypothetical protein
LKKKKQLYKIKADKIYEAEKCMKMEKAKSQIYCATGTLIQLQRSKKNFPAKKK